MFKNYIKERHPFFFNILSNLKSKMITLSTNIYKYLNKFYFFRIINYKLNPSFRKFKVYSYLKKDSVFIDIGANIGLYSLFVSDKYNSNIECFEPHPQAFNILSKRFKNKTKVKLNNLAVSDVEGTTELYLHQEEGSNKDDYSESASLYSEKFNVDPNKKIQIKTVDINKILNSYEYIDCIKINAEGVEFKILPQLINNRKKIKKVFCAFHDKKIDGIDDIYKKIIYDLNEKKLMNTWFYEME